MVGRLVTGPLETSHYLGADRLFRADDPYGLDARPCSVGGPYRPAVPCRVGDPCRPRDPCHPNDFCRRSPVCRFGPYSRWTHLWPDRHFYDCYLT